MKRFNIGDKVVALTNSPNSRCQKRVKGNIYTVLDVDYCRRCGGQGINIGGKDASAIDVKCNCGSSQESSNGLYYTDSKHFALADNLHQELENAVAEERYEDAQVLNELIK